MAAPAHNHNAVPQDTLITIKVSVNESLKKLKLPLRDLGASVLPEKLRHLLGIKPEQSVVFERFSDSAGGYITLDPNNPQVFKTLIRAAKAKLKLRLKATVSPVPTEEKADPQVQEGSSKTMEPVIVHSPVYQGNPRDSTAFDRRSIGSGIFQFREALASQQPLVNTEEAPVPRPFTTSQKDFFDNLALRGRESAATLINNCHPWTVYCNSCDVPMSDAHFHCSICDGGDYDLCEKCVASGKLCPGEGHWLIKRFIKDGKVIASTTERISPRKTRPAQTEEVEVKEMPGAFAEDAKTLADETRVPSRTCNNCVVVLPEREFVTCASCDDFDLCINCHTANRHGHHPAHGFKPANEQTALSLAAETMLAPGRNVRHNAICDGCDKKIYGVRHKCLNCPDWDFCSECIKNARHTHPRHRFAAIYQPIPDQLPSPVRHFGIYCDGPLCNSKTDQSYITGVRYKCAVCHDTDFCASCEASPGNHHNRTHPLIKFRTPVRNVSITTENEDIRGNVRTMGDRRPEPAQKSASTETTPVQQSNAATQVQTMAEIKPTEVKQAAQPIPVIKSELKLPVASPAVIPSTLLNAHFATDSIPDGMIVQPGVRFTQIWTLKNPGPYAWPAGCSVRYVGGDNMLNVDNGHPASVTDIANASESNVVGREVQVGEEIAFKVVLKAPTREGKAISYWRLKASDGTPFGHRLWCDVVVKAPEAPKVQADKLAFPAALANAPINMPSFSAAHLANMQRLRQQQEQLRQQQMVQMQRQLQIQTQQEQRRTAMNAQLGQPPAYDSSENLTARLAAMRAEQQKRREQMMAQLHSQREAVQAQAFRREDNYPQPPLVNIHPAVPSVDDKARKEAAKQRVEHIKAKIMRTREERAKAREAQMQAAAEQKIAEETEKVKKIIEEVSKNAEKEEQDSMEGSQMVFPKLDKESPTSSTYESATSSSSTSKGRAAYVENESGEIERSATPAAAAPSPAALISEPSVSSPTVEEGFEDLTDDLEVLSADGEQSEDDGFLTDEEYDILDASDSETVASK